MVFCVNSKLSAVFVGTQGVKTFILKTFKSEVSSNQTLFSAYRCVLDPYPSSFYRPCGCLIGGGYFCQLARPLLSRHVSWINLMRTVYCSRHQDISRRQLAPSVSTFLVSALSLHPAFPSHHPLFCYCPLLVCCILYPYRIINSCFHHPGASRKR